MRPVVILPPVEAFGGSFPMPRQLRQIPWDLARTSLTTRDPSVISRATEDYIALRSGEARPVSSYVESRAAFTTWKRNPYTGGATRPEYQGPAAGVPGYMAAAGASPATVALVTQGMAGLRGLSAPPPVDTMATHVDRIGANVVLVRPPPPPPSVTRLRPLDQRNMLPTSPSLPVQQAVSGHVQSEREAATSGILIGLRRGVSDFLKGL